MEAQLQDALDTVDEISRQPQFWFEAALEKGQVPEQSANRSTAAANLPISTIQLKNAICTGFGIGAQAIGHMAWVPMDPDGQGPNNQCPDDQSFNNQSLNPQLQLKSP